MTRKYDLVVFIGRFQPVHNAHIEIIKKAEQLGNNVLIIVGSSELPRTYKNPFSEKERIRMLSEAIFQNFTYQDQLLYIKSKYHIEYTYDSMYNDQSWVIRIQELVSKHTRSEKIAIIGHEKDDSSFYLKMFPQWDFINVDLIEPLHSTNIRDLYFKENMNLNFISGVVPKPVLNFLKEFSKKEEYIQIINERNFISSYKKQFEQLPYPPVFVTTDAVVIQSGHVLMIKRRSEPGKGLFALPGGFLNVISDKSIQDGMIRELKEETGIKVPVPVLIGNIKNTKVFDAVDRSTRGRTITHAFHIQLPDGELPKVKGGNIETSKCEWIPIGMLKRNEVFEDHKEIIDYFVGI